MSVSKGIGAWALTPLGAVTLATVAVLGTSGGFVLAASGQANFSLASSVSSISAPQGQSASFTVTMSVTNGFSSSVALSVSGLPDGASAIASPTSISKSSNVASIAVTTNSSTPVGDSTVTVTGTSGTLVRSAQTVLHVTQAVGQPFSLSVSPATSSMLPGDTAVYDVGNVAGSYSGAVALSLVGGLPTGAMASFAPSAVAAGATSKLTVTTKNNTPSGSYTLTIAGNANGQPQQTAQVGLNLTATGRNFTVNPPTSASPALAPGLLTSLNLVLTNPNSQSLSITNLTVNIQSVTKATNAPAGDCTPANYTVTQFGGSYPLTIPAGQTVSLAQLGVPMGSWPALAMPDSRSQSQDGCKGATVNMTFTGAGQGG